MKFEHRSLPLNLIDFEDQTFCLSFPCRASNLVASIDLVGIINPPVVRERAGLYQIVCGRGRLEAARKLGHHEVVCKVLPPWVDDLACLSISFEENITTRGFNLVEKALVVERFLNYLPDEEVMENLLPRLGFSPRPQNLEFLKGINFLEEKAKELLAAEELNPQVAQRLLGLDEESRRAFLSLVEALRPSFSRQREILEILLDLSRREEKSLGELLKEPQVAEILAEERLNPREKSERVFKLLRQRLYPHLSAREEAFKKVSQRLSALGLRLKASPFFEKDSWQVEFQLNKLSELKEKWPRILAHLEELASEGPQERQKS